MQIIDEISAPISKEIFTFLKLRIVKFWYARILQYDPFTAQENSGMRQGL